MDCCRPNKWWIDPQATTNNVWKEWAYATDPNGQHYYCERWERLEGDNDSPVLALRKLSGRDGILVVVGDHFNYCIDRSVTDHDITYRLENGCASLGDLVDTAIRQGDLETARRWLSVKGGHGRISSGWIVDCAIEFWKEGQPLWGKDEVQVEGNSMDDFRLYWNNEPWEVFQCNLTSVNSLRKLLLGGLECKKGTLFRSGL
jgi:hypothetical protein